VGVFLVIVYICYIFYNFFIYVLKFGNSLHLLHFLQTFYLCFKIQFISHNPILVGNVFNMLVICHPDTPRSHNLGDI
jgi:hypothetical protein